MAGPATIILDSREARIRAKRWIDVAPAETTVRFKRKKRSIDQNDKLWACLTDVAEQATWAGKRRTTTEWKDLFTAAVKIAGGGVEAVPGLEGGLMLLGLHTSDMTVGEMVELIEYIIAWGTQNGVAFREPEQVAA